MKNLPAILLLLMLTAFMAACNSNDGEDNYWEKYRDWRLRNEAWYTAQRDSITPDGKLFYQTLSPVWNPSAQILVHYHNDRAATAGNLSPLLTSTVDIRYHGSLSNGTPFDSSYTATKYGPAIARMSPKSVVQGFAIALMDMRVGDSCTVVIPYELGYGGRMNGSILPYSALKYEIGLVDIPFYEIPD